MSSNTWLQNLLPEWATDCFNIWLIISPLLSSVQAPKLGLAWSLPTFSPGHSALSPSFSLWSSLLGVSLCFLLSSLCFVTLQPATASGHQPVSLPSTPVSASHHVASLPSAPVFASLRPVCLPSAEDSWHPLTLQSASPEIARLPSQCVFSVGQS